MVMLNTGKGKIICFNKQIKLKMNDRYLGHSDVEKGLGVMISRNLTWSCQAERRFGKATYAFEMLKRNISAKTSWLSKKQLYRSYSSCLIRQCSLETF